MILLENVSKSYMIQSLKKGSLFSYERHRVNALNNISFEVSKGEIVGYVGLNGSGKSTTIKLLSGMLLPDSGIVRVNGANPFRNKANCYNIGAVFGHKQQLWIDLPVRDSFEMLRGIYSVSLDDYTNRLDIIDSFLEIKPLLSVPSRKLSLGQRMKCEFAASLIHNPKILLLDEPTIGVDLQARKGIIELLLFLNKEYGVTILLTTHNLADIEALCERIILINRGSIVFDGSREKLCSSDTHSITIKIQDPAYLLEAAQLFPKYINVEIIASNEILISYSSSQMDEILFTISRIQNKYGISAMSTQEKNLESVIDELCKEKEE